MSEYLRTRTRARAWKDLAKLWRRHARYVLEKPTLGAAVRNYLMYCEALKILHKRDEEVAALKDQLRLHQAEEERLLEDRRRDRAEIDALKAAMASIPGFLPRVL